MAGARSQNLSGDEKRAFEQLDFFFTKGVAYAQEMGGRPQTLYGIADSPIGLAAWFLDHDKQSYEFIARAFDGKSEGFRSPRSSSYAKVRAGRRSPCSPHRRDRECADAAFTW